MPGCVLRYCKNNSKNVSKCKGTSFHRFPRPNHENREKWIKFVRKNRSEDNWMPSEFACICSLHFRKEDKYTTDKGRLFLKKSALPCNNPDSNEDDETLDPKSEPVSDSESDTDTTTTINILRHKLRHSTLARKKLTEKIKKVQRQNRNLQKKCEFLTNVVTTLKKRILASKE